MYNQDARAKEKKQIKRDKGRCEISSATRPTMNGRGVENPRSGQATGATQRGKKGAGQSLARRFPGAACVGMAGQKKRRVTVGGNKKKKLPPTRDGAQRWAKGEFRPTIRKPKPGKGGLTKKNGRRRGEKREGRNEKSLTLGNMTKEQMLSERGANRPSEGESPSKGNGKTVPLLGKSGTRKRETGTVTGEKVTPLRPDRMTRTVCGGGGGGGGGLGKQMRSQSYRKRKTWEDKTPT